MTAMSMQQLLLTSFFISLGCAVLCAWFADRKGRNVALWGVIGFVIGVIALVIIAVLPSRRPPRPPRQRQSSPPRLK